MPESCQGAVAARPRIVAGAAMMSAGVRTQMRAKELMDESSSARRPNDRSLTVGEPCLEAGKSYASSFGEGVVIASHVPYHRSMTRKRVFFLPWLPPPGQRPRDFTDVMQRTGGNTGNIFFVEALRRQLAHADTDFGTTVDPYRVTVDPLMVRENFDYIAVPAANWLAAGTKISGSMLRLIEGANLPCLVAGLCAQSLDMHSIPNLSHETQRFLHLVSERSKIVGVRGEYTLRVVEHYGVKNAAAVGCPSYFWSLHPVLSIRNSHTKVPVVAVNGSRHRRIRRDLDKKKRDLERELYLYAFHNDGSFIVPQTEEFEIRMALETALDEIPREAIESFRQFVGLAMPSASMERVRSKFRVFTSVAGWTAELAKVDFVVGTRLHGCIMGLAAGVPSLLITIDSRTAELAELLKIPTIEVENVQLPIDMAQLYERADVREAISEYPRRFQVYKEFLEANGAAHKLVDSVIEPHAPR
jgi:hypothetical protein